MSRRVGLLLLAALALGLPAAAWWARRRALPRPLPDDIQPFEFVEALSIAPLPSAHFFRIEGTQYKTLGLTPSRSYDKLALPDLPQLVEANGGLPPARRVLFYSCVVNDKGLRGARVYSQHKPPHTWRVGVIGTGVSFGEGVEDDETFSARLEASLNDAPPRPGAYEVVNFGTPCLTTDYALSRYLEGRRDYDVDYWVFALGVNDALPMFHRPADEYREAMRALVDRLAADGVDALFLVEPVNTFYPWMQKYREYRGIFEEEVGGRYDVIDMAGILDCDERQDGLRLVAEGDDQRVVQYRSGEPRVLDTVRYHATQDQQYIAPEIYDYLDSHYVWMRDFITDVHLNPRGHRRVAATLDTYLRAHLRGQPAPHFESCPLEEFP